MTPQNMHLTDYVAELTRPHTHREHYTVRIGATLFNQNHQVRVPALLHQLRFASASGHGDERSGSGYESRPAASIDSLDTLVDIDLSAARWVRELGEDDPGDTLACVQLLNGLSAHLPRCKKKPRRGCCDYHDLERDVRHWWAQARVVTGWDSPAWRPDNSCPMCDARLSLRIKLVEQVALCVECRETWDPTTIGLLAEHIRAEAAGTKRSPQARYCWCPWPRPETDAWPALCPSCASPWCHRAGWSAALEGPGDTPEHAWVS